MIAIRGLVFFFRRITLVFALFLVLLVDNALYVFFSLKGRKNGSRRSSVIGDFNVSRKYSKAFSGYCLKLLSQARY